MNIPDVMSKPKSTIGVGTSFAECHSDFEHKYCKLKTTKWFEGRLLDKINRRLTGQIHERECDGRDLNPGYQIGNLMS